MKNVLSIFTLVIISVSVFAQSPEKMSYQSVVRNTNGNLVQNTNIGIRVSILKASQFGAAVFVETHTTTTNSNGLLTIEIGNGTPLLGSIDSISWGAGPYFIKTEIDPNGASSYSISSISQLLSVPYALYAKNCGGPTFFSDTTYFLTFSAGGYQPMDVSSFVPNGTTTIILQVSLPEGESAYFRKNTTSTVYEASAVSGSTGTDTKQIIIPISSNGQFQCSKTVVQVAVRLIGYY